MRTKVTVDTRRYVAVNGMEPKLDDQGRWVFWIGGTINRSIQNNKPMKYKTVRRSVTKEALRLGFTGKILLLGDLSLKDQK